VDPGVPAPAGECRDRAEPCEGLEFAVCIGTDGCAWEDFAENGVDDEGCVCHIDENGEEVCECQEALVAPPPPEEGQCVPEEPDEPAEPVEPGEPVDPNEPEEG